MMVRPEGEEAHWGPESRPPREPMETTGPEERQAAGRRRRRGEAMGSSGSGRKAGCSGGWDAVVLVVEDMDDGDVEEAVRRGGSGDGEVAASAGDTRGAMGSSSSRSRYKRGSGGSGVWGDGEWVRVSGGYGIREWGLVRPVGPFGLAGRQLGRSPVGGGLLSLFFSFVFCFIFFIFFVFYFIVLICVL